jgi:hypothetical protein
LFVKRLRCPRRQCAPSRIALALLFAPLVSSCDDDYADAPRYQLPLGAEDGRSIQSTVVPAEDGRLLLDFPSDLRGFLVLATSAETGGTVRIDQLIGADGATIVDDGVFWLGDGTRKASNSSALALALPNHDVSVSAGGLWRLQFGEPVPANVEVWTAMEAEGPRRVDVRVLASEIRLFETDLALRVEGALRLLDLELGDLRVELAPLSDTVSLADIDNELERIPAGPAGSLTIALYASISGASGYARIPGVPRSGTRPGAIAVVDGFGSLLLAHEIGHFVGLHHPTDETGHDLLDSTPECALEVFEEDPESCPDLDNLMAPHPIDTKLTDEQRYVIAHSLIWHR